MRGWFLSRKKKKEYARQYLLDGDQDGSSDADEGTEYIVILTKKGIIKKTAFTTFRSIRKSGRRIINIQEDDEFISVRKTTGEDDIFVVTQKWARHKVCRD